MDRIRADVVIIGGSLGGCAAADAVSRLGGRCVLTEEAPWIGGQLTSQAVPPDEHPWIEHLGATARYRALRDGIRAYYHAHLPLSAAARRQSHLNPGNGWVSRLCHDPRVAVAVLQQMLAPHVMSGRLTVLQRYRPIAAWSHGDRVIAVVVVDTQTGRECFLEAPLFIDATDEGELLPFAGVEHVVGAEARSETGEPHAPEHADPESQQAITWCFAMENLPGEDHVIERPRMYGFWRDHRPPDWPGPLLGWTAPRPETGAPLYRGLFDAEDGKSLWNFRRILDAANFEEGFARSDVTLVNWPQNDYRLGPICGVDEAARARNLDAARQLSLSLLYWLQTEAPRPDGGAGYPGLRLRADVVGGTADGLAQRPYIRESRRIRAEFTVLEQHIAHALRPGGPELFSDAVGVGSYRIDLHPRTSGAGYLDMDCWQFQIPLGALIPVRIENLLAGCKNLGVTQITNGAFRLHPVEWNTGEVAGLLAMFCLSRGVLPRKVRRRRSLLTEFQSLLHEEGIPLSWPRASVV